jgi:cyanophycinase
MIMGYILLEGGAEFRGRMATPDRQAIVLAGGVEARLSIIPAAAAPDKNYQQAGQNGVDWFQKQGAVNVNALPLIDRKSADDPAVVEAIERSRVIAAHRSGAVIAGSSAGAMVLCDYYYDPHQKNIFNGLGLISDACILPHHDTFGKRWAPRLAQRLVGVILIGIDEETGLLNDGPAGQWQVYGAGGVTLYKNDRKTHFTSGKRLDLKF